MLLVERSKLKCVLVRTLVVMALYLEPLLLQMELAKGVLGEANNDGTIFLSNKIKPGSEMETHVTMHEMVHLTDMKLGKLAYSDNAIKWNGEVYARKNG
jgi:Mlc titration factor MtfA (ptsG expression regulator)